MEIKSISLHDLRKMNDSEGLVLQGCGGDLQEWVDGINDMLTESGILQNDNRFEKAYSFKNGGLKRHIALKTEALPVCCFPLKMFSLM